MSDGPSGLSLALAASVTLVSVAHSTWARGLRSTLRFVTLSLAVGAAGEYLAVNLTRRVVHHTAPRVAGVPVAAILSWYAITYGAFATAEELLLRRGRARPTWSLPIGTAVLATSLDLLLDAYGLDRGLWEWSTDGVYAAELAGPNGRRGIPLGNFLAWLAMTGGVSSAYVRGRSGSSIRRDADAAAWRPVTLLLPFYLPAAAWALRTGRPRFLLYSCLVPLALVLSVARPS